MNTLKKLLVLSLLFNFSCTKKELEDIAAGVTPTDGSQSAAQLAGSGQYCEVVSGLQGGNRAVTKVLTLNSDNTFSYSAYFSDQTTCATAQNTGGNNTATVFISGAWTAGGTNTTPSTGTKILFVVGSTSMTIYAGAGGGQAEAVAMANFLNGCSGTPSFSTNSTSTRTLNGNVCNASGGFSSTTIPANNENLSNTAYSNGGVLQIGLSTSEDIWRPGGTTFPTSYTNTYLSW